MTVSFNKDRQRWMFDFQHKGKRHQGYCLDAMSNPDKTLRKIKETGVSFEQGQLTLFD